jgi:hypothetical protein
MNAALEKEILALPANERAKLIDLLWESLGDRETEQRETGGTPEAERSRQCEKSN